VWIRGLKWGRGFREEVTAVNHLRVVNGGSLVVPSEGKEASDICLVDYSHCPTRDLCWVVDIDNGCVSADSCVVDWS
jgi:hypothetical protein